MGTLIGHVAPGLGFLLIGIWHLYNHIKLFSLHPKTYRSSPWFPAPKLRHLELLLIALGSSASIAMELFIGPANHQPLDPDLTIPSNHLHNFEHASISLAFLLYAASAIAFDAIRPRAESLTALAAAAAFAQQLLLFHLHSADHGGVEGQYHGLLQMVIGVSLATTLMGMGNPRSFAVGFVRSVSVGFQGIWFVVMGIGLWTPGMMPKGCFMNEEEGHVVVRCGSGDALRRAKGLVNVGFSWCFVAIVGFSIVFYVWVSGRFVEEVEYGLMGEMEMEMEEGKSGFLRMGKEMRNVDRER